MALFLQFSTREIFDSINVYPYTSGVRQKSGLSLAKVVSVTNHISFRSILVPLLILTTFLALPAQTYSQGDSARQTGPQLYKSRNFSLMTDISKDDAEELLTHLESMLKLVSGYWGRRNRKPIRMFVIDDFANWPQNQLAKMSPEGVQSVRGGGGLTITSVKGFVGGPKIDSEAIVYATSKRKTPQHEAIHAYCGINFGSAGPVWYAEGMAEVGKYWRNGERGVNAGEYVIQYLQSQEPKPLGAIVNNPLERTGDSWQNYAWRWVLCHMLGANKNYSPRFKPLGLALLADKKVSFDRVYGAQAEEIEFEYQLFVKDMEPGYRCDLCSWNWKAKFLVPSNRKTAFSKILAEQGWQASRAQVFAGDTYSLETKGDWTLGKDGELLKASGEATGEGQLIGIIFDDYELSEPFEIGGEESFTVPRSGKLFLRCRDKWGELADNNGVIQVRIGLLEKGERSAEKTR